MSEWKTEKERGDEVGISKWKGIIERESEGGISMWKWGIIYRGIKAAISEL